MIEIELKSYGSSDYELAIWQPGSPEDVFFVLDMGIGQKGRDGADLFYVTVATRQALKRYRRVIGTTSQGPIVIDEFSVDEVLHRVNTIIAACSGENWMDSVDRLRQHFDYEYADYKP